MQRYWSSLLRYCPRDSVFVGCWTWSTFVGFGILGITLPALMSSNDHLSRTRAAERMKRSRPIAKSSYSQRLGASVGIYKICVCWFRDPAAVNTIPGIRHLLYCTSPGIRHLLYCTSPPLYFAINIAQYLVSPRPPCFAIQHTILVMAISCKGQRERQVQLIIYLITILTIWHKRLGEWAGPSCTLTKRNGWRGGRVYKGRSNWRRLNG